MPKQFFSSSQIKESFKLDDASDSQQDHTIMLLSGPPNSGKTSMLFQYAYNRAVNGWRPVIFICNKKRMHSNPPFLSQGIDPSSDVFSRIKMKYIENDEEIRKYFAAFYLHDSFPAAVVIDDFGDFFDERTSQNRYGNARGRDLAMVRTLALSQDAVDHANKKLQPQDFCQLLLSDTHHGDGPRQLFVYKKWLSCIFTIRGWQCSSFQFPSTWNLKYIWIISANVQEVKSFHMLPLVFCLSLNLQVLSGEYTEGDGRGSFLLSRLGLGNAPDKRTCFAKYTVALQYLMLEGTVEE